ncbi:MAG TPA: helix-turn-helix domain-containing protein [Nitrososphaerales archaeon]|nr:helix-turn-helix domain-containing protein [Nitrososphaerales archaeon]
MCESPDCLQLTEREAEVCVAVCSSSEPVSFSKVRDAVGLHQELVSRILRRLMNYGAIEKSRDGYRRVSQ